MRQGIVAGLVVGVLLPLVFATSASAILTVSPPVAAPGDVVTVTGTSFSNAPGVSPVRIRLSTRGGQLLKSADVDGGARINTTFVVPPGLAPGIYLIIGTQINDAPVVQVPGSNPPVFVPQNDPYKANAPGTQRSFTPSRTTLRVQAAPAGQAAVSGGGNGGPGAPLTLLALVLAPGLLAAVCVRTARRRSMPTHPHLGH